jgi:hypothetical protein
MKIFLARTPQRNGLSLLAKKHYLLSVLRNLISVLLLSTKRDAPYLNLDSSSSFFLTETWIQTPLFISR